MDQIFSGIVLVVALFAFLASGVWVAISLLAVGFVGLFLFADAPIGQILATTVWGANNSWALAALPLFIWIGEILFRSSLSRDLFSGLAPWLSRLPGGLLHVNIVGCGMFAAVSGSSAATCATVGKMSVPELTRRGYDARMINGTLAGSGTLGLLIPPSIILIVYGVAIEESIARLFLAGVGPGLMMLTLFMGFVIVWALLNKDKMPAQALDQFSLADKVRGARTLIPILLLIGGVIGSIYTGVASPTDAAAVGVFLSLVLVWCNGETELGPLQGQSPGSDTHILHDRTHSLRCVLPDRDHGLHRYPALARDMDRRHGTVANRSADRADIAFHRSGMLFGWHISGGF